MWAIWKKKGTLGMFFHRAPSGIQVDNLIKRYILYGDW